MTAMNPVESKVSLKDTPRSLKSRRPMRGAEAGKETASSEVTVGFGKLAGETGLPLWIFLLVFLFHRNVLFQTIIFEETPEWCLAAS